MVKKVFVQECAMRVMVEMVSSGMFDKSPEKLAKDSVEYANALADELFGKEVE